MSEPLPRARVRRSLRSISAPRTTLVLALGALLVAMGRSLGALVLPRSEEPARLSGSRRRDEASASSA